MAIAPGAVLLPRFAADREHEVLASIETVSLAAPFRRMETPGGRMSVAMTNCGPFGWVADRTGYRYAPRDPATGASWPAMPAPLLDLARTAATAAGFADFEPDACLVNRYVPGSKLSLHQDRDEVDFGQPIVSASFGLPATFLFGGAKRAGRPARLRLEHGDVVVWGGPARLRFHGVDTLREGCHRLTGACRYNLTFRKAL